MTSRRNEQKRLREVEHIRRKRERYSDRGGCSCRNLMVKHVTATPYKAMLIASRSLAEINKLCKNLYYFDFLNN